MHLPTCLMLFVLSSCNISFQQSVASAEAPSICSSGMRQSPMEIFASQVSNESTENMLEIDDVEVRHARSWRMMLFREHLVGIPSHALMGHGAPLEDPFDLYSFHLYPQLLHSVEGMEPPMMELHLTFIVNLKYDKGQRIKKYDPAVETEASNRTGMLNLVRFMSILQAGVPYGYGLEFESFVGCVSRLRTSANVRCPLPMPVLTQPINGYYSYVGSELPPTCVEGVYYALDSQPLQVNYRHLQLIKTLLAGYKHRDAEPGNGRTAIFYTAPGSGSSGVVVGAHVQLVCLLMFTMCCL